MSMVSDNCSKIEIATNCSIDLINCRFIKPLDVDCLNDISKNYSFIITIEEGSLIGGFGSMIDTYFSNLSIRVRCIGIPDNYIDHGSRSELLDEIGLNSNHIIDLINENKK